MTTYDGGNAGSVYTRVLDGGNAASTFTQPRLTLIDDDALGPRIQVLFPHPG